MDELAELVEGPRARGAFVLRSTLTSPWSIRVEDEAPLTVVAVVRGHAWVVPDAAGPVRLDAGAVALLRGPTHYAVADDPGTPPQTRIHPGQLCSPVDPGGEAVMTELGVRTWGNSPDGDTVLLTGTYQLPGAVSRRLLADLPDLVVPASGDALVPLVSLLGDEVGRDEPGQEAVLDRLLDLLVVSALRGWFAAQGEGAPGWYRARRDPVVGPALRLLDAEPARVDRRGLAAAVGVSRATLARRFRELVGEPPMGALAARRLTLAAELLADPGLTLATVARRVGYGSPYALSAAFSRARGISPAEHRRRLRAG